MHGLRSCSVCSSSAPQCSNGGPASRGGQDRVEEKEIDTDIAFAATEHPGKHQGLIAGVPEPCAHQGAQTGSLRVRVPGGEVTVEVHLGAEVVGNSALPGGTTEVGVISLGGMVYSGSVRYIGELLSTQAFPAALAAASTRSGSRG